MRGKQTQGFTATNGVTNWTASDGTLSDADADSVTWEAPNKSGTFTVTATNGSGADIVTITVIAIVAYDPNWDLEGEDNKKVLVFEPDEGDRQTNTKADNNKFDFIARSRKDNEFVEMRTFWNDNYPGAKVYFTEKGMAEALYVIDSGFKYRTSSHKPQ